MLGAELGCGGVGAHQEVRGAGAWCGVETCWLSAHVIVEDCGLTGLWPMDTFREMLRIKRCVGRVAWWMWGGGWVELRSVIH
jgi:hypothetical protein